MVRLKTEEDIAALVRNDEHMMRALEIARKLDLPDWWIGAGFLRNKVWDALSGIDIHKQTDTDLVYYDTADVTPERDWEYDRQLQSLDPANKWEVRNQARMHYVNDHPPFASTRDGIAHWTETATAVAVRLNKADELEFLFCYGTDDLLSLIARPTPYMQGDLLNVFHTRMAKKRWQERWSALRIEV